MGPDGQGRRQPVAVAVGDDHVEGGRHRPGDAVDEHADVRI
jgi:hypothetical protein